MTSARNTARNPVRLAPSAPSAEELLQAARPLGDGSLQVALSVPGIHCGGCIRRAETGLAELADVLSARVNLSTRRVTIRFREGSTPPVVETLTSLGYPPHLFDDSQSDTDDGLKQLLRAVAISGFAAANIMLLSVSVWSGADGATRDLFHWLSALIAFPTLLIAGRVFYRSAWNALRHGGMNMDVPIVIGVTLAYAMSLYETINHGPHAYFDASVTLLFFLLIGRALDHMMRERARSAVQGLAKLAPRGAVVIDEDGGRDYRPLAEIAVGDCLLVAAGERIPVDGQIEDGTSDLDCSLVTGESDPQPVMAGIAVRAGTLNLTGPLRIRATARAEESLLAEMMRMMEAAEGGRSQYRRIADRVASLYAPVVHLAALLTFIAWMVIVGDWRQAMTVAIAVLIITCPCALGLAVPIVQVVAARRLFERGVMMRDGSAFERLAMIDTVAFDKTGTLTMGQPRLTNTAAIPAEALAIAAGLGAHSRHPFSQAIADAGHGRMMTFDSVSEIPGAGVEGRMGETVWRLGRAHWAGGGEGQSGTILSRNGEEVARFDFEDQLRPGAAEAVAALQRTGLQVMMLSGDTEAACRKVADALGITDHASALLPADKVARLEALSAAGQRALMVGDGLNDAPALGAAHVSMAPATAADIGRNIADMVFLRDGLDVVPLAIDVSHRAGRLVRQNIGLAILYNVIAVPIAMLGHVTPLIAAIAMSGSSLIVISNALRLGRVGGPARMHAGQPAKIPLRPREEAT